jgi:hypothetical protein
MECMLLLGELSSVPVCRNGVYIFQQYLSDHLSCLHDSFAWCVLHHARIIQNDVELFFLQSQAASIRAR